MKRKAKYLTKGKVRDTFLNDIHDLTADFLRKHRHKQGLLSKPQQEFVASFLHELELLDFMLDVRDLDLTAKKKGVIL